MKSSKARDLLDLHGFKADEVMEAVDRFLTQSNEHDLPRVRIMTGKGTGTIKKKVIELLKQAKYSWRYEVLSNGQQNEGVLVVEL